MWRVGKISNVFYLHMIPLFFEKMDFKGSKHLNSVRNSNENARKQGLNKGQPLASSFVVGRIFYVLFVVACCCGGPVFAFTKTTTNKKSRIERSSSLRKLTPEIIILVDKYIDETNPEAEPLIIGGSPAETFRFPYYCLLVSLDESNNPLSRCGGSLVHDDIVLSAAHCLLTTLSAPIANVVVVAGNIKFPIDEPLQHSLVDHYMISDSYNSLSFENDFLIMKLENPFVGIPSVKVNAVASVPRTNEIATAIGFGRIETGTSFIPSRLLAVDVNIQSASACNSEFVIFNENVMLCANDFGKGVCSGDSGGPLIIPGTNASSDVQVGITSFTRGGCADITPSSPDAYSRVSAWYHDIVVFTCTESSLNHTSPLCSGPLPTPSPVPALFCVDDPPVWFDIEGDGCDWYEANGCEIYGDCCENFGLTANQVCCVCGGGTNVSSPFPTVTIPTPSPTELLTPSPNNTCVDYPLGWIDASEEGCAWYGVGNRCETNGDCCENFGRTANEACCVCGGGQQQAPPLVWLGFDHCSFGSCEECEGDCDSDDDCDGTLECFHRNYFEPVPGCNGAGEFGGDYCYNVSSSIEGFTSSPTLFPVQSPSPSPTTISPTNEADCTDNPIEWIDSFGDSCDWYAIGSRCKKFGSKFDNLGFTANDACCVCGGGGGGGMAPPVLTWFGFSGCSSRNPCGECQGDCDFDSDCAGDLKCFERFDQQSVPGCDGSGEFGGDYCHHDPIIPTPQPSSYSIQIDVSSCVNEPADWIDANERGCDWYEKKKSRCKIFGDDNANLGFNANEACCICGGGGI